MIFQLGFIKFDQGICEKHAEKIDVEEFDAEVGIIIIIRRRRRGRN